MDCEREADSEYKGKKEANASNAANCVGFYATNASKEIVAFDIAYVKLLGFAPSFFLLFVIEDLSARPISSSFEGR